MLNNTHGDVISQQKDSPKSVESDSLTSSKPKSKRSSKGRVFLCTGYPGCNMSFTRSEHLARHKRKHTGERPFTCPYCSKNFSRLDNLRQHKQTVHAYETYLQRNGNSNDVYSGSQRGESEDKFQLDRTNASSSSSISSSSSKGRNDDHSLHHHHHYHPATPNNPLFSLNETGAFKSAAGIPQVGYSGVPGTMMSPPNSQSPHYHNQAYYMNGPSANHPHHPIQHGHQHLYPYQGQSQSHTAPQHQPSHSAPLYGQQYESQAPAHYPSQPPPVPPKPHQDNTLRIPKHQFKPKRRPRPLSLQHSFVNDPESESTSPVSMSSSLANNSGYRTAPANSTTFSTISKTSTSTTTTVISYPPAPKSASSVASLTPNLVSPLSPLFHQSFSQTTSRNNDRSSFGARSLHSLTMPSTTNFTIHSGGSRSSLPSIQHLPLNGNGDEDNNSIVGPISTISHNSLDGILKTRTDFANKMLPPLPQAAGDNTKTWLKGVLNDDGTVLTTSISPSTSDASCNDMDIKMEEVPSGQIPPNTTTTDILNAETTTATNPTDSSTMATSKNETANKILYSSKKPTINSLLSPTEHRKFS